MHVLEILNFYNELVKLIIAHINCAINKKTKKPLSWYKSLTKKVIENQTSEVNPPLIGIDSGNES